ncbi:MAG: DedA family protein [Pseudolysinimonas sp.]|jgi:membrane protein DedA with SNARE-associated domain
MNDSAGDPGGLVGFALWLIDRLGEWGVGAFTVLETVFPPIPSEVVLPLAGYQGTLGHLSIPLLLIASTVGSYIGALILYAIGRVLGLDRAIRWLAKLPLVDREDFEKAAAWFDRHGRAAIFFGRLVPGVRSLISLPAGASKMNPVLFSALTIAGSAIWNSLLIGLGALLGTQYELVDQYSSVLNYVVYAALAGIVLWLIVRRLRRRRAAADPI